MSLASFQEAARTAPEAIHDFQSSSSDSPGLAKTIHSMDSQVCIQHQAGADCIACRRSIAYIPHNGRPAAQLVAGHSAAGFPEQRVEFGNQGICDHPVHINPRTYGQPGCRIEAQLVSAVQVLHIHQVGGRPEAIPHAYENVSAAQERARPSGVFCQELAGFNQ
jgi:hypothetical protein